MMKLLKTKKEMENAYLIKKHYFIREFVPEHMERAHNSTWMEPDRYIRREVSEDEYNEASKYSKNGVEIEKIPMSYKEFIEGAEKDFRYSLQQIEYNPTIETVDDAIFAVNQYFYIVDAKMDDFGHINDEIKNIIHKTKVLEKEGVLQILEILEAKKVILEKEKQREEEELARKKAEKAEKRRLARIAKMKRDLEKLENQ